MRQLSLSRPPILPVVLLLGFLAGCQGATPARSPDEPLRGTITISGAWALYP